MRVKRLAVVLVLWAAAWVFFSGRAQAQQEAGCTPPAVHEWVEKYNTFCYSRRNIVIGQLWELLDWATCDPAPCYHLEIVFVPCDGVDVSDLDGTLLLGGVSYQIVDGQVVDLPCIPSDEWGARVGQLAYFSMYDTEGYVDYVDIYLGCCSWNDLSGLAPNCLTLMGGVSDDKRYQAQ